MALSVRVLRSRGSCLGLRFPDLFIDSRKA